MITASSFPVITDNGLPCLLKICTALVKELPLISVSYLSKDQLVCLKASVQAFIKLLPSVLARLTTNNPNEIKAETRAVSAQVCINLASLYLTKYDRASCKCWSTIFRNSPGLSSIYYAEPFSKKIYMYLLYVVV